jgi:hypothetical protein
MISLSKTIFDVKWSNEDMKEYLLSFHTWKEPKAQFYMESWEIVRYCLKNDVDFCFIFGPTSLRSIEESN